MPETIAEMSFDEFRSEFEDRLSDTPGIEDLGAWEDLQAELDGKESKPTGEQEVLDDTWRNEVVVVAGKKLSLLALFERPLHQVEFEVPGHPPVRNAYLDTEQPDAVPKQELLNKHFTEGPRRVIQERAQASREFHDKAA